MPDPCLKISEIFFSLQGEARSAGWPSAFVRLSGCPLRCRYCDTAYAFSGGETMTLPQILHKVAAYQPRHVCVTGGEPLAQKNCRPLLRHLCDAGYAVSLETSGALDMADIDPRVAKVMDLKTPDSLEQSRNRLQNIQLLRAHDQVKFVICSRRDYEWAKAMLAQMSLHRRCEVLFSPSADEQSPTELADWIVADNLPVRFQLQLHKLLWHGEAGR